MSVIEMVTHRKAREALAWAAIRRQATACWVTECWQQMACSPAYDRRRRLYAKARAVVVHDRVLRMIDGQPVRPTDVCETDSRTGTVAPGGEPRQRSE